MIPILLFDKDVLDFYSRLCNIQKNIFLLGGNIGTGKTSLLRQLAQTAKNKEPNSIALYLEVKSEAGLNAQLLHLEKLIFDSANSELDLSQELHTPYLLGHLRSKFNAETPEIGGRSITESDCKGLFFRTLELVSKRLRQHKILILIDINHSSGFGCIDYFLNLFLGLKLSKSVKIVIAASKIPETTDTDARIEHCVLNTSKYLDDKIKMSGLIPPILFNAIINIWNSHQGNLLVLDLLIRFSKMFGAENVKNDIEKMAEISDLEDFLKEISARMFTDSGDAEQMLLLGLACSTKPLTKSELAKAINWEDDFLEKVLQERSRLLLILDDALYKEGKLALFHSYVGNGMIEATQHGKTKLIHKRLAKQYIHVDLEGYWENPQDIGYGIYHLRKSEGLDIVYFLLMDEIKTLSRIWDLSDIMLEALKFALDQVMSYKPVSISFEIFNSKERFEIPIGIADKYSAAHSLSREYAYYLEINNRKKQASEMWKYSIEVLDHSRGLNAPSKSKMKALVWGDIAQLRNEEGEFSESLKALNNQISLFTIADVPPKTMAAAWHNLGLVYQNEGTWANAHDAFQKALSLVNSLPELQIEEILQIAHTWRLSGDIENAIANYQRVIDITNSTGRKGNYSQAVAYGYLALEQFEQQNLDEALRNAMKAMRIFESQGALIDQEMAQELVLEIQKTKKRTNHGQIRKSS